MISRWGGGGGGGGGAYGAGDGSMDQHVKCRKICIKYTNRKGIIRSLSTG